MAVIGAAADEAGVANDHLYRVAYVTSGSTVGVNRVGSDHASVLFAGGALRLLGDPAALAGILRDAAARLDALR